MGGKLCKKGAYNSDSEEDDMSHLKGLDGAGKLDEDNDMDPDLMKNSNLPEVFAEIDDDGTGQIEFPEFLQGFGLDNSPLTQKIFFLMDEDNSGALDYYEFLKMIDKYRKMTYDERLAWCFKVYDQDDSGTIEKDEFTAIIMDINYAVRSHKNARGMIRRMNNFYEQKYHCKLENVDMDQFKVLANAHGTLLIYPAMGVMERILGFAFNDPDNHLDWWDCLRPGQGGQMLKKFQDLEEKDAEF